MWRVSTGYREEIFCIYEDTSSLQDSEGSLGTRLFNVPKEVFLNALNKVKQAKTHITDSFIGRLSFLFIKFSVAILVKNFRNNIIPASHEAITVKIVGDIGLLGFVAFLE